MKGEMLMKKLKKTIGILLTVSILFGAYNVPLHATETENEVSSGENTEETSGFDENVHGEVTKEGIVERMQITNFIAMAH